LGDTVDEVLGRVMNRVIGRQEALVDEFVMFVGFYRFIGRSHRE
jgi:hypothetical protein